MKTSQTSTQPIVHFHGYCCIVDKKQYNDNKRTALQLIDTEDGILVGMATVNLPEQPLNNDEVLIKDYSENQSIYRALRKAGIVGDPIEILSSAYAEVIKCKLLI